MRCLKIPRIVISVVSCICVLCGSVNYAVAKTYYFSSSTGDDNRTETDAQDSSTPWKSLQKLNSIIPTLKTGDVISFKRGDIFYGMIDLTREPTNCTLSFVAYGSGSNPVITGLKQLSSWTKTGTNLWESNDDIALNQAANIVLINGKPIPMGRYPNSGWITAENSSHTSVSASNLGQTNWTGAQIVSRKERWIVDKDSITSQAANTINFSTNSQFSPRTGWGFFIQNDIKTLDAQNEWYYDVGNRKLIIYSVATPSGVSIADVSILVSQPRNVSNSFSDLEFNGSNGQGVYIESSLTTTIKNCVFRNIGGFGVAGYNNTGNSSLILTIDQCQFDQIANNAIFLYQLPSNITNNTFSNIGTLLETNWKTNLTLSGISATGNNINISRNQFTNIGYDGINFTGNNCVISENFIDKFCTLLDDGGGIYTYQGGFQGRKITNNIVVNGVGNNTGTDKQDFLSSGIYLDEGSSNVEVNGNTVANNPLGGIFIHKSNKNIIQNNKAFNNKYQIDFEETVANTIFQNQVSDNFFIAKTADQLSSRVSQYSNGVFTFGDFNNNCYSRPINDEKIIEVNTNNWKNYHVYNLSQWKSFSGQDANSYVSAVAATSPDNIFLFYNATNNTITTPLNGQYKDVAGKPYSGSVSLASHQSQILIKVKSDPQANAGNDQTLDAGVTSTQLSGTGKAFDGATIVSYQWAGDSKIKIDDPNSQGTGVEGLTDGGKYSFVLTVTDDQGLSASDTVLVTVKKKDPSINEPALPPVANAGASQVVSLPVNSVSLSGSGSSPSSNKVVSYQWVKKTGPSAYTIANPNAAATVVTDLEEGIYEFELTVTDDKGATGTSTVKITVNAAPNKAPVANAGEDISISAAENEVQLTGSGTDADGTIVKYQWVQTKGPSGASIKNPENATTAASNLTPGEYEFQLTVTDDKGATATATVKVTIKAAVNIAPPNIAPIANAGDNITISEPATQVQLSGSGTDVDGTIVKYQWIQTKGPSGVSIKNPENATTAVSNLTPGEYEFQLTVTDNKGATATATVKVTVKAAVNIAPPNIAPIANAGDNITISEPATQIQLSGSGTDADGTVVKYQWLQTKGPSGTSIQSPGNPTTVVDYLLPGEYEYQLTVTDNKGATGKSTVTVIVLPSIPVSHSFDIIVYPNPTRGNLLIAIQGAEQDARMEVSVTLLNGVVLMKRAFIISNANTHTEQIDLGNYTEDVYILTLRAVDGQVIKSIKVIKTK